jgi:hypothetical protein
MPRQVFVGTFGTRCFIGSALIREWRGNAREVHALEEEVGNAAGCCGHVSPKLGLLLRETEPDITANGAAFLPPA